MKNKIVSPTLLVNKQVCRHNIKKMTEKAARAGVLFRPHFKTHQSAEIGEWFRELGVNSITVSSLDMAIYFAENGWNDITVAIPVNIREIDKLNRLASRIDLNILIDSEVAVQKLQVLLKYKTNAWIKIDAGYGRSGINWKNQSQILSLTKKIKTVENLDFAGILTHSGHSYLTGNREEIILIHDDSLHKMKKIQSLITGSGIPGCRISVGDTPTCTLAENFEGVDEIRPGNFVFFDLTMVNLGVCRGEDMAVVVACPVIGKYKERKQIVVYGGGVHLSKEALTDTQGNKRFGYLTEIRNGSFTGMNVQAPVISLSQEHGILQLPDELLNQTEIGDLVYIYPVHSCMTANLYDHYLTLEGETITRL